MPLLLRLPPEVLQKIFHAVQEADPTLGPTPSPSLLALYRTCKAVRQAMLPCIGSMQALLAEDEVEPGDQPGRDVFAQFRKFPSAATLRSLHLEIGPWTDDLSDILIDQRLESRLAGVVELSVISPGAYPNQPTNWRVVSGMVHIAFPLLRSLALFMDVPPSLYTARMMHGQRHLADLRIHCVPYLPTSAPPPPLDDATACAIALMTNLKSLSLLQANDYVQFVPLIAAITGLRNLRLYSEAPMGIRGINLPHITMFSSLPVLTELAWCGAGGGHPGIMPVDTLSGLVTLTQLAHLDIRDHAIQSTAHVQMLASMPQLKKLVVYSLHPDSPVIAPSASGGGLCAWRDLSIVHFNGSLVELSRLPLVDIEALNLGSSYDGSQHTFKWDLGNLVGRPEAVVQMASCVKSLFRVLARTRGFNPHDQSMLLSWDSIPSHPVHPIIAATAQLSILHLIFSHWDVDGPMVRLLSGTQPRLQNLTLTSCRTFSTTWAAIPVLTCLTHLHVAPDQPISFIDEDFRQLALFASNHGRELTLTVHMTEFEAFKQGVMARRQTLGKAAQIQILNAPAPVEHEPLVINL